MLKFNKDYNLKIISTTISIILLFTSALYSYSFPKKSLRLQIGTNGTYQRINIVNDRELKIAKRGNEYPKKILLVYVADKDAGSLDFPTGVYALKSYLENAYPGQCIVEVKDVQLDKPEDIINFVTDWKPHMIGLSLMSDSSEKFDKFTSKLISCMPQEEQPLLALGKNVSTFASPELLKKYPMAICVKGEGELAIGGLLEYLEGKIKLQNVPNITYLDGDNAIETKRESLTDLQAIGKINYSFAQRYISKGGNVWMETSRGCPWGHCTFCSTETFWGTVKWRDKPIETIVEELKDMEKLGIKKVTLTDEEFFGYGIQGVERARELALAIIKSGVKISFHANARADAIYNTKDTPKDREKRIETLKLLKQAGLDILYLGIESGSVSQLKRYAKGMDIIEAEMAIKICKELDINMAIGWLMFEPLVTVEQILENLEFIKRNEILPYLSTPLNQLRMYPSIPYFQLVKAEEKKSGKKLIDERFEIGRSTFKIVGYKDERVEAVLKLLEKYSQDEYDLYNALKWFVRFNYNAQSYEFKYIQEFLNLFKENQINFLHQLVALPDRELLKETIFKDVFKGAVFKRGELIKKLKQMINNKGHLEACKNIMGQIDIYLVAGKNYDEVINTDFEETILKDSRETSAFISLLVDSGKSVPKELRNRAIMQYYREQEAISITGMGSIMPGNKKYDSNGKAEPFAGISAVAYLKPKGIFTELVQSVIGNREDPSTDADVMLGLPGINKWQKENLGTIAIATALLGSEHITLYAGVNSEDWFAKYEHQLNQETKAEIQKELKEYPGLTLEKAVSSVVQKRIIKVLQGFKADKIPRFKPIGIEALPPGSDKMNIGISVAPVSIEDLIAVTRLQEAIKDATGLVDFGSFKGHVRIGYFINPIVGTDFQRFKEYLSRLDKYIKDNSDKYIFEFSPIDVIIFFNLESLSIVPNGSFEWTSPDNQKMPVNIKSLRSNL